ncbi:MAG: polyprenyl synthetase family protein [Thermodesulfobacteriota bacterium]
MKDLKNRILDTAAGDLEKIEKALLENLQPNLDLVSKVAEHILFSGGKRLRPLLMVLCARLCGYQGGYDHTFSVIFEYLHAATLLHDDLIDEAPLRRGKPAAHTVWGSSTAVLVGDFLLARGLSIAADTGRPKIIEIIADITENMSQGEIHQLQRKGELDLSEAEYMEIIRCKTAVLFQGACRISALLAEAAEEKQKVLADYGFNLGMAFQMVDDLLDYSESTATIGKSVGADLKEGKLTLPVIYALQQAGSADRQKMEQIIQDDHFSVAAFEILKEMLRQYGGIAYTENLAMEHITKAKDALNSFAASETRDILMDIADYAVSRKL